MKRTIEVTHLGIDYGMVEVTTETLVHTYEVPLGLAVALKKHLKAMR